MAFQPAPACAQAVLRFGYTVGGIFTHANVLNFVKDAGTAFDVADLELLADILEAWFLDQGDALLHVGYQLMTIELRGLESAEAAYTTRICNDPGTVAGDSLPPNVAACLSMTTGFTGRSSRGRMYWGGLSEVQQDGGTLAAGVVTGFNDLCADLLNKLEIEGLCKLAVLSRFTGGAQRATAHPLVVTDFGLRDAVLDTQRRRINRLKV